MKLHADTPDTLSVTAYGKDWIAVNGQRHHSSIVLGMGTGVSQWGVRRFDELTAQHFDNLIGPEPLPPELVIFGSGPTLRFVRPAVLKSLIDRRIGVETMDTAAACRTYNILAGEKRRVVAALLIED
jgi:uncharacterized protein